MFLPLLLLTLSSVQATCPANVDSLRIAVDSALEAYDKWVWTAFAEQVATVRADVSCLQQVPAQGDLERLHLLHALVAYRASDVEGMRAAFKAVLAVSPNYSPPESLAAIGSDLRKAWEEARKTGPGAIRPLGMGGSWYVDGRAGATEIPTERKALVQLVEPNGELLSWYLEAKGEYGDIFEQKPPSQSNRSPLGFFRFVPKPEPPQQENALVPSPIEPKPSSPGAESRLSRTLAWSALGAGIATGAAWGYGVYSYGRWEESPDSQADRWLRVNHASMITSGALGLATSGLLIGAVVKGEW